MFQKVSFVNHICLSLSILALASVGQSWAADLLVITHQNDVNKKITAYTEDGTQLLSFTPEGDFEENIPTWIVAATEAQRFFVAATVEDAHHEEKGVHEETEGRVEVFEYAVSGAPISHVTSLHTGNRPFHMYIAPDGRAVVANDEDGTISLIDPFTLDFETITAGFEHGTIAFEGSPSDFDIYVGRFNEEANPGGVDIANSVTGATRTRIENLLPNPHSAVYSPISQRVYFAAIGGLEVIGTQGAEMDMHVGTVPLPEGNEAELKISQDGRMIYGNIIPDHHDEKGPVEEETEPQIFAYDVINDTTTVLEEAAQAADIDLSPDGNFIIAGDFEPHEGEEPKLQIIDADPDSPTFMTVLQEYDLGSATGDPTVAGFSGAKFSSDGDVAYVTLTQRDEIMVIDMSDFSTTTFPVEAAPWFLQVIEIQGTSSVDNWDLF